MLSKIACLKVLFTFIFLLTSISASFAQITGAWTQTGPGATWQAQAGDIYVRIISTSNVTIVGAETMGCAGSYSDAAVDGNPSIRFTANTPLTGNIVIGYFDGPTSTTPVLVATPILHVDRVGGAVAGVSNSALYTLASGTWTELSENDVHFESTTTSFNRRTNDIAAANAECGDPNNGTAAGSLSLDNANTGYTINTSQAVGGPDGGDAIELVMTGMAFIIDAVIDDFSASAINGVNGGSTTSVLANDTLNGSPVTTSSVALTPGTAPSPASGSITMNPDGTITVAPGTTAGTYSYPYTICETANPTNCDTVTATVVVDPAPIDAVDDDFTGSPVNGVDGGDTTTVLANDTLNGVAVVPADVTLTPGTAPSPASGSITMNPDGTITVAPDTTAGTYTYDYTICEVLNPANCDTATATVVVDPAPIDAVDDDFTGSPVNGVDGGDTATVLANDTLNGVAVVPADVTLTPGTAPSPASGSITMNPDGTITVAPDTTAGTYTYDYTICEVLNPANCDTATATVVVDPAPIDAVDDDFTGSPVNGVDGGDTTTVLANDTLNGVAVVPADVTLTPGTAPSPASGSITMNPDGTITVAPDTTAGTYTYDYTICEVLNPANCDTATATVVVDPAPIDAVDDTATGVDGITGATDVANVFDNDTLNGSPVDPADVTLTETIPDPNGYLTLNPDGSVDVAPGTPAGTYPITYQICEVLNPANCDTAVINVTVDPAPIDAVDDDFTGSPVNGVDGGDTTTVLANDTLNGVAVVPADVTLTPGTAPSPASGSITMNPDGTITVAPDTTAGTYTYDYTICEVLNPANCDTATATVVVDPAPIDAVDDDFTGSPVNGVDGGDTATVLANDTLNGVAVVPADVTLTPGTAPSPASGSITMNPDGTITVAPDTTAGTYTYDYTICEVLNPANCDTATATVVVDPAPIDAVDDDFTGSPVNGVDGGDTTTVLANDTLNGVAVVPADVTLTPGTAPSPASGSITMNPDGTITVAPDTTAGTYTYDYTICEVLNPANCDTATATVVVDPAPIDAVDDSVGGVDGITGATDVVNVFDNDTLNGSPVDPADVTLTETIPDPNGYLTLNPDGSVDVAPGTPAGTYPITYQICEVLNPANCDTAVVNVTIGSAPIDAVDDDFTGSPVNGVDGGDTTTVLANDTLNGSPVVPADVTLTPGTAPSPASGSITMNPDGTITVAPDTTAGTYTYDYTICEVLNPANCDTATATVVVDPAPIDAVDDDFTGSPVNGVDGGDTTTVLANDTLNGVAVVPADVTLTPGTAPSPASGSITMNPDGTITVAPDTTAGTYTYDYTICEVLNPANCDTATATVVVDPAPIDAVDDDFTGSPVNGVDGGDTATVLANDTLNGVAVVPADVTLTPGTAPSPASGSITMNPDGTITVAPDTTAGTYTYDYTICEVLNPANCDTATATVVVDPAPIDAVDDTATGVDGITGATDVANVFDNDTLNGSPVDPADVTLTETIPDPNGYLTLNPDGSVDVAPGTPAGTYPITYQICEVLNPANCDTAVINVTVDPAPIDAVDDDFTGSPVNGVDGGDTTTVLANDTLNGVAVVPADVTLTPGTAPSPASGSITMNPDGTITVAPDTTAGTYTYDYTICEVLNPANCDTATATVVVDPAPIDAVDDSVGGVDGITGATDVVNVFDNDTLNGSPVDPADVTLTETIPDPNGYLTLNPDGSVDVAPGTPAGTYPITYQICEVLNPANCDTAVVNVTIGSAPIDAVDDDFTGSPVNGVDGGDTTTVLANDTLNGSPVVPADVTLTPGTAPSPASGSITMNPDGTITVAPDTTAGTYTYDYTICEVLNPANCDTATATVVVDPAPIDAVDDDFTGSPVNGVDGGDTTTVLANDTLNGVAVVPADVTLTPGTAPSPASGSITMNPDGTITVAPDTTAGTYTYDYTICEVLNPANCDTATATVVVDPAPIDAVDDDFTGSPVNGVDGGDTATVLANDTLNGVAVVPADVTLTPGTAPSPASGSITMNPDGTITVAPDTTAGTYTYDYTICEVLNPANCDTATATVVVDPAPIDAVDDTATGVDGITGATDVANVFDNDTLNGSPVDPADVTLTETIPDPNGYLTLNPDGSVDVAPGTPAGTYPITYQICEVLNPANCDTAVINVTVDPAPIDAVDDDFTGSPVNGVDGGDTTTVLANDTLNGVAVVPADVTLTPGTAPSPASGSITMNPDGTITVAPDTTAGTYTYDYTICEVLNPANCDTATATVVVDPAPIDAVDDSVGGVDGITGATDVVNVFDNDTLNGSPVDPADVTLTETIPDPNGYLTLNPDGSVDVAPGTPAGTYPITYQICEVLNPANCDTAVVNVTIGSAPIDAVDDDFTGSPVNGVDGGDTTTVLANDTLNGSPVVPADVTLTPGTAPSPVSGSITMNPDGTITVAPDTTAGTYTYDYTICEVLNPANCDTATATVVVDPAPIDAVDDTATGVDGITGATDVANVFDNDTLNGSPVDPADVTLTETIPDPNGYLTLNPDGSVDVAPGTPAGTYPITYQICEVLNPANCDTAVINVTVDPAPIDAVDDDFTGSPVNGVDGGDTTTVLANDTLNGVAVVPADVTLTPGTAPSPASGSITMNPDGTITVAPDTTAGTYTYDYTICEVLNPANCDTATATVVVDPAPIDAVDDDFTGSPVNGVDGGDTATVLANDTLNGVAVVPADVTLTPGTAPSPASGSITMNPDGTITVAPDTTAGTYTYDYTICEVLNPANCDTATATVVVDPAPIDAVDDDFTGSPVNGVDGGDTTTVLANDTLNGVAVVPADVTLTPGTAPSPASGSITMNPDGTITVAPDTTAGTYTYDYTICEVLNPANCDTATATVVVDPAPIDAVDDSVGGVDGITGATDVVNVFDNDTLNGSPVDPADVTLTETIPDPNGYLTLNPDGSVDVAPGTPAGTYPITYQICEVLNPANCDTAVVNVTIGSAPIDAVDDDFTGSPVNGVDGGDTTTVLANDTLNGSPVVPADVTLTPGTAPSPVSGSITMNPDGTITVAPDTTAGTYTYDYTICEVLNPANCDTATATVVVDPAPIDAVDDTATGVDGITGATDVANVFDNDTLNGSPVDPADVTLTETIPDPNGYLTLNPDGSVDVAPGTPAGTYPITYQICEVLNPANCDTAVINVTVDPAPIDAVDDDFTGSPVNGVDGGDTTTVLANDTLNGVAVVPADVTLTPGTAPSPASGSITMNPDGTITVAPDTTAGTYTYDYTICEVLNPANCDTATATVVVDPAPIDAVDDDFTGSPVNGVDGGDTATVLANDTLNGVAVVPADVTLTPGTAPSPASGSITMNPDGTITVAPDTTAGTYTYDYTICEVLNPANCDTATATVVVDPAPIDAVDDDFTGSPVNGVDGGDTTTVLANDTLNGVAVVPADVTLTPGTAPSPASGSITMNPDGTITVAPDTTAGTYTYDYTICEVLNPTNCDTATATVDVGACLSFPNNDCDGDGVINSTEVANGTDPDNECDYNVADITEPITATTDCDNDGLLDVEEITGVDDPSTPADPAGNTTDPADPDTDGDGVTDGQEALDGTDPNDECDYVIASITLPIDSGADCDNDGLLDVEEITGVDDPSTPADPAGNTTDPADPDTDGDGVTDGQEALDGTDPNDECDYVIASITLPIDSGADCDNDGLLDVEEITGVDDPSTPADPAGNTTDPADPDTDGDGVTDGQEALDGTDPNDECDYVIASITLPIDSGADCDNDGLLDVEEITGVDDPSTPADPAGNTTDPADPDTDGDGVTDGQEALDGTDPNDECDYVIASITLPIDSGADCDNDGLLDVEEITGVDDPSTPADPAGNTTDPADPDTDGDGVTDGQEALDGTDPNDECDYVIASITLPIDSGADCDNDGLLDVEEITGVDDPSTPADPAGNTTDPADPDTDGDGVTDGQEALDGTDPNDECDYVIASITLPIDSGADCDNDGLLDVEEITGVDDPSTPADPAGNTTDPADPDTDGDGVTDGQEALDGTDPNDECDYVIASITLPIDSGADCDNDGLLDVEEITGVDDPSTPADPAGNTTDPADPDTDGDGVTDGQEALDGTDPNDECDYVIASITLPIDSGADCDNDGLLDVEEITGVDDPSTPADPAGNTTDPADPDTDGDGVTDGQEALDGTDPNDECDYVIASITLPIDSGADCDNDGLLDVEEITGVDDPSTPADPAGNTTDPADPDTDGDGVTDGQEALDGTDPNDECDYVIASITLPIDSGADCDNDGLLDVEEITGVDDPSTPADPAGNTTDPADPDTDGDGVTDGQEALDGTDPNDECDYVIASITLPIDSGADCDNDGLLDVEEITGVDDPSTPADPAGNTTDPADPDTDGDGVTDGQEALDGTDPNDECDYVIASITLPIDSGADCDNDGLLDVEEITGVDDPSTPADPAGNTTDPADPDTDGDGVTDGQEALDGTDPNDECDYVIASITLPIDSGADCDNDGLLDVEEITGVDDPSTPADPAGNTTDPADPDTDGDGVTDGQEALDGTDPNDECDYLVASITLPITAGVDCDGDGVLDATEVANGTDPNDACDFNVADITEPIGTEYLDADCDGDGVTNGQEITDGTDPDNFCDYLAASQDVTMVSPEWLVADCDGDGVINETELDDNTDPQNPCDFITSSTTVPQSAEWLAGDCDFDNVPNGVEFAYGDTDGDGMPNWLDPDDDNDGIDTINEDYGDVDDSDGDVDPTGDDDPTNDDSDGDSIPDYLDTDDDNDGILTIDEYPDPNNNGIGFGDDAYDSDGDGLLPDYLGVNNATVSEDDLEIFNAVTPNGDGDNDVFVIRNIERFPDNTVKIYNRWGVIVFETSGYGQNANYFTGESNGRVNVQVDEQLPVGTYFYIVEYNKEGETKSRAGYLYIQR
ncbi:gliding motility-associated C-terminal domain-containing protein [Olleya sp. R77988]|uniref:T9SS type B sorting domain-containing protein n=1 Tax=Olleya sp. R77988 TaxID=3093875 RepID=UPI0037C8E7B5